MTDAGGFAARSFPRLAGAPRRPHRLPGRCRCRGTDRPSTISPYRRPPGVVEASRQGRGHGAARDAGYTCAARGEQDTHGWRPSVPAARPGAQLAHREANAATDRLARGHAQRRPRSPALYEPSSVRDNTRALAYLALAAGRGRCTRAAAPDAEIDGRRSRSGRGRSDPRRPAQLCPKSLPMSKTHMSRVPSGRTLAIAVRRLRQRVVPTHSGAAGAMAYTRGPFGSRTPSPSRAFACGPVPADAGIRARASGMRRTGHRQDGRDSSQASTGGADIVSVHRNTGSSPCRLAPGRTVASSGPSRLRPARRTAGRPVVRRARRRRVTCTIMVSGI